MDVPRGMTIVEDLQAVLDNINAVRQGLTRLPASNDARGHVRSLASAANTLESVIGTMKGSATQPMAVGDAPGAARLTFGDALAGLGQAMVGTQRILDDAAARYARRAPPGAPVSLFRVPKMKAGFRFAIERLDASGLNLVFWGSQSNTRESNQQSIELEIVAVPPDPDQKEGLTSVPAAGWLLLGSAERRVWLVPELLKATLSSLYPEVNDRVVLIEQADPPFPGGRRVLAVAHLPTGPQGGPIAGAWILTMDINGNVQNPEVLVEFKSYDAPKPNVKPDPAKTAAEAIGRMFEALCRHQASL